MKRLRIAVGGSAGNPPQLGHRALVRALLRCGLFDVVAWIPSGVRPEKPDFIAANHRVAMTMLTFPNSWFTGRETSFVIDFEDVYGKNTPTIRVLEKLRGEYPNALLTWYTGVDSVADPLSPDAGSSFKIEQWIEGKRLMQEWDFLIIPRQGYPHPSTLGLAKNFKVLDANIPEISSSDIRRRIREGERWEHLVSQGVARYIKRHRLYGWKGDKK